MCGKERKSQVCAGGVPEESVVAALDTEGAPGAAVGPLSLQSQFYTLQVANSAVCPAHCVDAGLR